MAKIQPVRAGGFSGINNVTPEHELALADEKTGCELIDAVNVDLTARGRARRRKGLTVRVNLDDSHSLWATADEQRAFFVVGTTLREVTYDGVTWGSTTLRSDMTVGLPCVFLEASSGDIYYSNGVQRGRIGATALREWGVERPGAAPVLAAGTGILPPGRYQVVVTFLNVLGEEGGASLPAVIDLAAAGGINVTLPAPASAEVQAKVVYCTTTNGETFYAYKTVAYGVASVAIGSLPDGGELETFNMDQLPPGTVLAEYSGRIYSGSSNVLWYTEPYRYGLARMGRNFVPFDGSLAVVIPTQTALWISTTDMTYQLVGNSPLEAALQNPLPYGAIPGTAFALPTLDAVGWFSPRGVCIALSDGQVKNQTDGRIILQPYETGRAFVREQEGVRQFVGMMKDSASPNTLRVSDFAEAELRRKGE